MGDIEYTLIRNALNRRVHLLAGYLGWKWRLCVMGIFGSIIAGAQVPDDGGYFSIRYVRTGSIARESNIKFSVEDHFGLIWLISPSGIYRYDGVNTRLVPLPPGSPPQVLSSIVVDQSNRVWVGSELGVYIIDARTLTFIDPQTLGIARETASESCYIVQGGDQNSIFIFTANAVWEYANRQLHFVRPLQFMHLEYLTQVQYGANESRWYLLSTKNIYDIANSDLYNDQVFLRKTDQIDTFKTNFRTRQLLFFTTPSGSVSLMREDLRKKWPGIYFRFDPAVQQFLKTDSLMVGKQLISGLQAWLDAISTSENKKYTSFTDMHINSIRIGKSGAIYLGTTDGFYVVSENANPIKHFAPSIGKSIRTIYPRSNTLFIGGYFSALDSAGSHLFGGSNMEVSILPKLTQALIPFRDNTLLLGLEQNKSLLIAKEKIQKGRSHLTFSQPEVNPPIPFIHKFATDGRTIWTVCKDDSLFELAPRASRFRGVAGGLNLEKKANKKFVFFSKSSGLWIGTLKNGIFRFSVEYGAEDQIAYKALEVPESIKHLLVTTMYEGTDGVLWLGTSGQGLWSYHYASGKVEQYSVADGLSNDNISGIEELESSQSLWVSTFKGISVLSPNAKMPKGFNIKIFGEEEFNTNAQAQSKNYLFWGAVNGLFYLDKRRRPNLNPVEGSDCAEVYTLPSAPDTVTRLRVLSPDEQITLSAGIYSFKIRFLGNDPVTQPEKTFAFAINGIVHALTTKAGDEVFLSGLAPGKYFIRFWCQSDLVHQKGNSITIYIEDFWYNTWWFRLLVVGMIALAVYLVVSYRMRQANLRHQLKEQISQNLHDDLGARLFSLQMLASRLASGKITDGPETVAGQIRDGAVAALRRVRDFTWALDPRHDNISALLDRIDDYLRMYVQPLVPVIELNRSKDLPTIQIPEIIVVNILLTVQEVLTNLLKHTSPVEIRVEVTASSNQLNISIISTLSKKPNKSPTQKISNEKQLGKSGISGSRFVKS